MQYGLWSYFTQHLILRVILRAIQVVRKLSKDYPLSFAYDPRLGKNCLMLEENARMSLKLVWFSIKLIYCRIY